LAEKEKSEVLEESDDDEDYQSGKSDFEGDDDQYNFCDDDQFAYYSDDEIKIDKNSTRKTSPHTTTGLKFAADLPNPSILKNSKRNSTPEMAGKKIITTCDVVNIPGNPKQSLTTNCRRP
jgi:hypothetical protein